MTDEHLQSIQGMQEATTDEFFYTRLKARMQKTTESGWTFPLKPVWVVGSLTLLLVINGFMLMQRSKAEKPAGNMRTSIQSFAESYDQTVSSVY